VEVALAVLAVTSAVAALALWLKSTKMSRASTEQRLRLQAEVERMTGEKKKMDAKAERASTEVNRLQNQLADAIARRDEKAMGAALWELEIERSFRQWRDVVVPTDPLPAIEGNSGQQLSFAVGREVERLREEVGVAIRFDGGLDLPLEPESALGTLRIAEELLALAAKQSDEVVVSLDQGDEPSISLAMECEGWDGDAGSGHLETELGNMASRLDGWLRWSQNSNDPGKVHVNLRLPAPQPSGPASS